MIDIVQKASEKAGGIVALARELGIRHTTLYSWTRVPDKHVLDIERVSGVSRHKIRPDIFGPAPEGAT